MRGEHSTHTELHTYWFGLSGVYTLTCHIWCAALCVVVGGDAAIVVLINSRVLWLMVRYYGFAVQVKRVRCVQFLVGVHLTDLSLTLWPRSVLSSFLLVSETQPGEFLTPSAGCFQSRQPETQLSNLCCLTHCFIRQCTKVKGMHSKWKQLFCVDCD